MTDNAEWRANVVERCRRMGLDTFPKCPVCGSEATNISTESDIGEIAGYVEMDDAPIKLPVYGPAKECAPTGGGRLFVECCGEKHLVHEVVGQNAPPPGKMWTGR